MSHAVSETLLPSEALYREVSDFLFREALLLDESRFKEWLELLTDSIRYILVAPNLSMSAPGVQTRRETVLMDETLASFQTRVQQLTTPAFTLAENPRPFTRRFVTNVMMEPDDKFGTLHVRSNALVYRSRGTQMEPHVFSMSRRDVLCRVGGRLRLERRDARLDEAVVGARNIVALW